MNRLLRLSASTVAILLLLTLLLTMVANVLWSSKDLVPMLERYAEKKWPMLQIDSASGSLQEGIEITHLVWQLDTTTLDIQQLVVQPDWSCLWYFTVCLQQVSIQQLLLEPVADPARTPVSVDRPNLYQLSSPIPLDIKNLDIEAASLLALGIPDPISRLRAKVKWVGAHSRFKKLDFHYQEWRQESSGSIEFSDNYHLSLQTKLYKKKAQPALNSPLIAQVKSKGELSALNLDVQVFEDWPSNAVIEINLLDPLLPWSLQGNTIEGFKYQTQSPTSNQLGLKKINVKAEGKGKTGVAGLSAQLSSNYWKKSQPLTAQIKFDPELVQIQQLQLQLSGQGRVEASGDVLVNLPIKAKLKVSWENFLLNNFVISLPEKTLLSGTANVDIDWNKELQNFGVSQFYSTGRYGEHAVDMALALHGNSLSRLTIEQARLTVGDNKVQLQAPWLMNKAAMWKINLGDISQLFQDAGGRVSGVAKATSLGPDSQVKFQLTGKKLSYQDVSVDQVKMEGNVSLFENIQVKVNGDSFTAGELTWQQMAVAIKGKWDNFAVNVNGYDDQWFKVAVQCDGEIAKTVENSVQAVELACHKGTIEPVEKWLLPDWQLTSTMPIHWRQLEKSRLLVKPFCLSSKEAEICNVSDLVVDAEDAKYDLAVRNMPVEWFKPWISPQVSMQGLLHGSIKGKRLDHHLLFNSELKSKNVKISINTSNEPLNFLFTRTSLSIDSHIDGMNIDFDSQTDTGAYVNSELNIDNKVNLAGNVTFSKFPLAALMPVADDFTQLQGSLQGRLVISGTVKNPYLNGAMNISDGKAEIIGMPWVLDRVGLKLSIDGNHLSYIGDAKVDEGSIAVDGQLDWLADGTSGKVNIIGKEIHYQPITRANVWLNPDLQVGWINNELSINGRVEVPRAFVVMKQQPVNSIAISGDSIVIGADQSGEQPWNISADVDVVLGDIVKFRGFGLEALLDGSLKITHSPQTPWQGRGFISLLEGSYRAYGQNLKVRNGDLIFTGSLENPVIRIDAIRPDIEPPTVAGVRAEGTLQDPTVTVFSSPAMAEQKALYFLLTGKAPDDESSGVTQAMVGQAALSYGLSKSEGTAASIANKLGIYDFQMTATEGKNGPKVYMGGYVNPKLHVSYGVGTFDNVNELTLRYRLRNNLFVEAISSAANALDLLWSFRVEKQE